MIKILDDSKRLNVLVNDTTNGLGQFQPLTATVTEELNGIFEAEITLLATDKHFKDLKVDGLLDISVGENKRQMFRIYYISKPLNNVVTIKAQHITYDLNKVAVKPFTATGAVSTKNKMLSNIVSAGQYPFTMTTNITNTSSVFTLDVPKSFRECLGGWEGSILDVFRPEYEWDNLTVKMLAKRGSDNGVRIAYGKNLTDLNQEENIQNVYTSVLGFARVNDTTYVGSLYNKVTATYPRVLIVDFSSDFDYDATPTVAELTTKAREYATNNAIETPQVNLTISFVPLYQTEEYKNIAPLERVSLGDTVHVYFDKLGVEASSRVIKTVWNANLDRYDSVELGSTKANLNTVINQTIDSAVNQAIGDIDMGAIESELVDMSKLVINGLGLYFTKQELSTGGYRYILHNKPQLADSDTQYYMSAGGIMVSNDYGQTWVTGYDPQTGTLATQALSTIILRALEIYGSFLRFGSEDTNYIDVAPYSNSSNVPQGVSFDGTGTIRMQPQGAFYVNNLKTTGEDTTYYNRAFMTKNGSYSANIISLVNYDDTKDLIANLIWLQAHRVTANSSTIKTTTNRIYMENDSTINGNRYVANSLELFSQTYNSDVNTETTGNSIYITNYSQRSANDTATYNANLLAMIGSGSATSLELRNYKYKQSQYANNILFNNSANNSLVNVYNALRIQNYNATANTVGNRLTLFANQLLATALDGKTYSTKTNNIYLDNKLYGTENTGNSIYLGATATVGTLEIKNGYHSNAYENAIIMSGTASGTTSSSASNGVSIYNRYVNSAVWGNYLTMASSRTYADFHISNNKTSGNTYAANYFEMIRESTRDAISLINYHYNANRVANQILMTSNSTANTLFLENYDSAGNAINYIRMNIPDEDTSSSNRQTYIYANSDLKLYSGSAVRLKANYNSSSADQDIYLEGKTIKLIYTDKCSFYYGGYRYNITFGGTSGNVTYTRTNA